MLKMMTDLQYGIVSRPQWQFYIWDDHKHLKSSWKWTIWSQPSLTNNNNLLLAHLIRSLFFCQISCRSLKYVRTSNIVAEKLLRKEVLSLNRGVVVLSIKSMTRWIRVDPIFYFDLRFCFVYIFIMWRKDQLFHINQKLLNIVISHLSCPYPMGFWGFGGLG